MINVSKEFLELMQTRTDFKQYADITFVDGTTLTLEAKDFTIGNNSVNEASDSDSLPLGASISRKIKICLMNNVDQFSTYDFVGAKIRLYLKYELSATTETINFGTFTVTDPETYGVTITITAYDDMYKADKPYTTGLSFPQTAGAMLRDICTTCGISLYSATFRNDNYVITEKPDGNYTCRQVIGWIAMIAGGNARINRSGALEIISYDFSKVSQIIDGGTFEPWIQGDSYDGGTFNPWTTGDVLDGGSFGDRKNIHVLHAFKNLTVDTDDIVITGVSMKEDEESVLYGEEGYLINVENPLVTDKKYFVQLLGDVLIGARFRKFSGDHIAYPLAEAMDLAIVLDRKGNAYSTIITDVNFVFFGFTTLKNSAASAIRNSSKYNSQSVQTYVKSKELIEKQKTEFDKAIEDLSLKLSQTEGAYTTIETLSSGGKIFYLHNKPTVAESQMIWKMTAEAWGVSTDGGKTWNAGMTVDGVVIAKILNTIGVNADWINAGALTVKDESGNTIFEVDMDTNKVFINAQHVTIGSKNVSQAITDVDTKAGNAQTTATNAKNTADSAKSTAETALSTANNAQSLSIVMTNEYQGVPTDSNGNYSTFPTVSTAVKTYFGHSDVSSACTYSVSKSNGVTGSWNSNTRVYTVTALTVDTGYVDITASYLNAFTVTKRFTIAKVKAGAQGAQGPQGSKGDTGAAGRTYFLQASTLVMKIGADKAISPRNVTFSSYYRDGTSATRTAYAGRFVIQETLDGSIWTTKYTSSSDETSRVHTPSSANVVAIKCTMYAAGGTTTALDMQTVSLLIDVDNLSQEQIFNILTNNGQVQGVYLEQGKIYINASYIKSGTISADLIKGGVVRLGGSSGNGYSSLEILDDSDVKKVELSDGKLKFYYDDNHANFMYVSGEGLKFYKNLGMVNVFIENGIFADFENSHVNANFYNLVAGTTTLGDTTARSCTINSLAYITSDLTATFDANGKLHKKSSSSELYKDIERVLSEDDIENLYSIDVYSGKYKDGYLVEEDERNGKYMPMFVVENIEKYLPIAISHNPDGSPEMWSSQIMIPVMFQMLKCQKNEIDSLKNELAELKQMLSMKGVI